MAGASSELEKDYASALRSYLRGGGEASLKRAYDLGRRAVNEGAGLLAVLLLHQETLAARSGKAKPAARLDLVRRGLQFLAESMAPFEMAHRGFQDAYARLRELNEEYETVVAERTREFRDAEARFRAHVEQLPAVTYIESVRSRAPVYVSSQVESVLGFTPRLWLEEAGRWAKQIHPADRERILAAMSDFRDGGAPFQEEYRLLSREGREVWVRHEAARILDDAGRPQFTQGVLLDISDRKRAEAASRENEDRFRGLFAISAEAMLVASARDGRVLDANSAAEDFLGYRRGDLQAKSLSDLLPKDHARLVHRNGHESITEPRPWIEVKARTSDGSLRSARVRSLVMRTGLESSYLCVFRGKE